MERFVVYCVHDFVRYHHPVQCFRILQFLWITLWCDPMCAFCPAFDGVQRSSANVFGSFSPSGQALLAETDLGLMVAIVVVSQWAL